MAKERDIETVNRQTSMTQSPIVAGKTSFKTRLNEKPYKYGRYAHVAFIVRSQPVFLASTLACAFQVPTPCIQYRFSHSPLLHDETISFILSLDEERSLHLPPATSRASGKKSHHPQIATRRVFTLRGAHILSTSLRPQKLHEANELIANTMIALLPHWPRLLNDIPTSFKIPFKNNQIRAEANKYEILKNAEKEFELKNRLIDIFPTAIADCINAVLSLVRKPINAELTSRSSAARDYADGIRMYAEAAETYCRARQIDPNFDLSDFIKDMQRVPAAPGEMRLF